MRTNKIDTSTKKNRGQVLLKRILDMKKSWLESSCDTTTIEMIENQGFTFAKFK